LLLRRCGPERIGALALVAGTAAKDATQAQDDECRDQRQKDNVEELETAAHCVLPADHAPPPETLRPRR
jgi:hypothetical protein